MTWGKLPWKIFILVKIQSSVRRLGKKRKGNCMWKNLQNQFLFCFVKKALNTGWKKWYRINYFLVCFLLRCLWKYVSEHFWQALKTDVAKQSVSQSSIESWDMSGFLHLDPRFSFFQLIPFRFLCWPINIICELQSAAEQELSITMRSRDYPSISVITTHIPPNAFLTSHEKSLIQTVFCQPTPPSWIQSGVTRWGIQTSGKHVMTMSFGR